MGDGEVTHDAWTYTKAEQEKLLFSSHKGIVDSLQQVRELRMEAGLHFHVIHWDLDSISQKLDGPVIDERNFLAM